MTQKQRANYWLAICLLYPGGEQALIAQLHSIAAANGITKGGA
jgi:hypothetical protein